MPVVEEFESLSEKLARVTAECEHLRAENEHLRRALAGSARGPEEKQLSQIPTDETVLSEAGAPVHAKLSVPEKIALFRSLFRGREDVYALRWEAADGKPSYSPACIRDWKALRSVPEAERRKLDKVTRQLLPLTDEVINAHLSGKCTAGIYPLLPDDTCWFLAVDFDQESWKLDGSHLSNRAGNGMFLPRWSVRARGTERTSGCSSAPRFRQVWHANSERVY